VKQAISKLVDRAVASGDIRLDLDPLDLLRALAGVARLSARQVGGFLLLMGVQLTRASKTHPTGLGALPAVIRAGLDQVPLEGGKARQNGRQKLALRGRGVAPRIVQRLELGALLGELVQDIE
jgi:hypothetical protein